MPSAVTFTERQRGKVDKVFPDRGFIKHRGGESVFYNNDVQGALRLQPGYEVEFNLITDEYVSVCMFLTNIRKGRSRAKQVNLIKESPLNSYSMKLYLATRLEEAIDVMLLSITNFPSPWLSILMMNGNDFASYIYIVCRFD